MSTPTTPSAPNPPVLQVDQLEVMPTGLVPLQVSAISATQADAPAVGHRVGSEPVRSSRRWLGGRVFKQLGVLRAAEDRMKQLEALNVEVSLIPDLNVALERIVVAAMRLTGARYGAIGMRADDGTLSSFVHAGLPAQAWEQLGQVPIGTELLLALAMERGDALRLQDLTQHPVVAELPENHPLMRAFLGVPITIRGLVFGGLYLSDDSPVRTFTESDEIAAKAVASAAGVAVDNLQLLGRLTTSARWLSASRDISATLLAAGTNDQPLRLIAQRLQQLTHAEDVMALVPAQPGQISGHTDILVVSNAVGAHANEALGQRVPVNGSTAGEVFRSGTPVLTESYRHPLAPFTHVGRRPTIVTALRAGSTALGVIALTGSPDQPPFNNNVLELVSDFAEHVSMALALATVRARGRVRHRRLHRPDPPTQHPDH